MRYVIALLPLLLLLSCQKATVTTYMPPPEFVGILTPHDGDTLHVNWFWPADSAACNWGFGTRETRFMANIIALTPRASDSVRLFKLNTSTGSFAMYGNPVAIAAETLSVAFGSPSEYGSVEDRFDSASFYITSERGGSTYTSPAVTVYISGHSTLNADTIPIAPWMDNLSLSGGALVIQWCDRSFNEDGFRLYYVMANDSLSGEVAVGADSSEFAMTYYHPHEEYLFWVTAWNFYGESAPSDTLSFLTGNWPM